MNPVRITCTNSGIKHRITIYTISAALRYKFKVKSVINSYILVKEGAQATLTAEKSSKWIYDIITSIDEIENTSNNEEGTIRVYDLSGKQVYVSDVKKFQIDNIPATGVLIIRNGSLVKKIIK